jgi:hypothetical protein
LIILYNLSGNMRTVDALSDGKAIEFDFDISTKSNAGTNKNQQG